jgi:gliding motility-associated-like protein
MTLRYFVFLFIILTFTLKTSAQQITTDSSLPLEQLIQQSLGQNCVEISNISSNVNGSINGLSSFGYFERDTSNFPFNNGIVLTSGDVNAAGNGQNNAILNDGETNWGSDPDLEAALGSTGYLNATSIQFDFVSIANQIQFNYIFASEEYFGNFPCNNSDGFAFLIREAGSTQPFTNIALIPGTSTPVNTNTIHDEIIGFCDAANEEYFDGYNLGDTNYNGRTTVLSAVTSIQPNVQYQIKLVIADQTDRNYDSAVFIEGNSFDASVDLGEDFSTCSSNVLLNADIENPSAVYSWFFNNAPLTSANQATFNAIQTGNYRVEIEIPFGTGSCFIQDDINLVLNSTQSSEPLSDYNLCDDLSNDGVETFDLTTKDAEVLASVPPATYTFSYHFSYAEAFNDNNAITTPIQNTTSPQTIHVRIEDVDSGCLAFSTINLNVYELPVIIDPTPLILCGNATANGSTSIDLNELKDAEITNGQTDLVVTYHNSASEASNAINAISMPYSNSNTNEQLFVSVMNPATGCNSTTTIDLTVIDTPDINREEHYIDACDTDYDGFASFDLTSIIPDVLQGITNVSVTFHTTQEDAISDSNAITNTTNFQNTTPEVQVLYIRVEDNATGCASVTPIEVHTNLLLTGTNINDITVCDADNDGTEEFDFASIEAGIANNIPDVTINFYETEADRDSQINPIDKSVPYDSQSNPQTIYITLESLTCLEVEDIELILAPVVDFDSIGSLDVCDEDQDGFTVHDLSLFDAVVTGGQTGFSVRYFLTEEDATNNTNVLPNLYTNTENPFTLFPRISFDETGCADINSFEVQVLPAPLSETPDEIIICDADRDGFSSLDLNNSIPNSVITTPDVTVSLHNSQNDAELGSNPISNISNYSAQTEIVYMRVTSDITGCYAIEELNIIVNTLPYVGDLTNFISEYIFCEDTNDGVGEFIFETKDAEALDGQTGKNVSYYLNQDDADAKINAINKTSIYQNISNPQEIFVRVDNVTDESCYTTSSFNIEVGTNPQFNEPSDLLVCDDASNDGSETFDLTAKISEVTAGFPNIENVTFYVSENDAINSNNPLPLQFANTVNPQEIFVQIDNGTICKSITSFVVNIIQVPDVSPIQPLEQCDNDADGFATFDLTIAELNILDIRPEDLVVAYYENFEDTETDSNPIANPESYTNTSNPQTTYIKITNIVSNCSTIYPIELVLNPPPIINDFMTYNVCFNGTGFVDLTEINPIATDVNFNVLFSYYSNEADALAGTNALETNYNYITNNDTLFLRAEFSTTRCFDVYEFNLRINPLPIANQPQNLIECDDDFDGMQLFDLTNQTPTILGNQNPDNFTVTYFRSPILAEEGDDSLNSDAHNASNGDIITARVENNDTGCFSLVDFSIIVNPRPLVNIPTQVVCLDNLPLLVSAETFITSDTYLWSTNETTPEIEITDIGTYSVTVTTEFGCATTSTFNVIESETATIETAETIDFSDPNNITVTVSGIGNYLFQLNDNDPQESNVFQNVPLGYNTVTIIDLNGCDEITKEVLVIDAPKFFTPNGDTENETWHIVGIETLPGSVVYIFDRYGKLLKQINADTQGWDGTYNGNNMPATDYWFLAEIRQNDIAFEVKGHFALRR